MHRGRKGIFNSFSKMIFRIIFWNGVLTLNGKENKEAGAICFELRVPRKKNKKIFWKVPSKIYESNFIMEKKIWVVNISKYYHREMGKHLCTVSL